ncbi:MAG: serine/threonine protein kinase [Calditrichaeota bacterium]|nr:MAG: serine/threonine protein kinase [Calditrichota bacterium]
MKNPFIAGNWVRGEKFFGRKQLIAEILEGERHYLWIAGTRRFGKTSLLKQIEYLTNQGELAQRYISLFWDLQGSRDADGLKDSLLESIEDAEERFAEIGVAASELEDRGLFEILRSLKRRAKDANLSLMLLCDEAEELISIEKNNPEILPKLRRFFQRGENLYTVLTATRRLAVLERSTLPETSPFLHGFVPPVYLTCLEQDEARKLMQQWKFTDAEVATILEKTNCHPFLLQLLCKRLVETRDLEAVIEEVSHDNMISQFFSIDFQYLDAVEKDILLYLLENKTLGAADLARLTPHPEEKLGQGLFELVQMGLVEQESDAYHIANYFFEKWLEREKDALYSDSHLKRAQPRVEVELRSSSLLPQPGSRFAGHEIVEKLGSGGMGVVFKARDLRLERLVAIKVLLPEFMDDAEPRERFLLEARAASALSHPGIAVIYQVGEEHGIHFISMEYVAGETLGAWLKAPDRTFAEKLDVALQVARALTHAHEKQVVHRDIKSDNIMVGEDGRVKVMDFGLAKVPQKVDPKLTKSGTTLGTLAYMSPEQAGGLPTDHRTDIFSFGVVLYELFTGKLPFSGEFELSVLYSIMNEEPEPLRKVSPELPEQLEGVVTRALQKDRELRYQRMADLLRDLEQLAKEAPPGRSTPPAT